MMAKFCLLVAALLGAAAVMLGAFGSHALQNHLNAAALHTWETAVFYHFVHALALLGVGIVLLQTPGKLLCWAGVLFLIGVLLFSGSLYLLALTGTHWLGAITPLGGLAFIAGWLLLAIAAWRL